MFLDKPGGTFHHAAAVHPTEWVSFLPPKKDILGDGKMGRQEGFLVHHGDANGGSLGWALQINLAALPQHLAGIAFQHSRHDLHQRGLACAVLAEQKVNFTLTHRKISIGERRDSSETLLDSLQFEQHCERTSLPRQPAGLVSPEFRYSAAPAISSARFSNLVR